VKQAEATRAELVKKVISRDDEEEELSWDVEGDEKSGVGVHSTMGNKKEVEKTLVLRIGFKFPQQMLVAALS
jgi:hypothetical protein